MPVLRVEKLTKIFPTSWSLFGGHTKAHTAVNNISFHVGEGEIVGLLGPNGAGKTTTIHMLLSTLTPTSGSINYFGKSLDTHRSELLQLIGFASTYAKLPSRLSVYQNLDVYGRLYGLSDKERSKRIRECLTFFGMWEKRDRDVGVLSAGETTRAILAKAFLANPKIVLLDEPTASLDPDVALEVRHFVELQRSEHGTSFLITSHNMDEVTEVCDRVLFLKGGNIIADSTPELLARSIAIARVMLLVGDGLKRAIQYVAEHKLNYRVEGRSIEVEVDEREIASLLMGVTHAGVNYSQISIEKPSLEDYFVHVSKS